MEELVKRDPKTDFKKNPNQEVVTQSDQSKPSNVSLLNKPSKVGASWKMRVIENKVDLAKTLGKEVVVRNAELLQVPPLGKGNRGHEMLVKMGWRAGEGLGRAGQGRTEPVVASALGKLRAGLGSQSTASRWLEQVEVVLVDHIQQGDIQDIVFGPGLAKREQKVVKAAAHKYLMKTRLVDKFLVLSSLVKHGSICEELVRRPGGFKLFVGGCSYQLRDLCVTPGDGGQGRILVIRNGGAETTKGRKKKVTKGGIYSKVGYHYRSWRTLTKSKKITLEVADTSVDKKRSVVRADVENKWGEDSDLNTTITDDALDDQMRAVMNRLCGKVERVKIVGEHDRNSVFARAMAVMRRD